MKTVTMVTGGARSGKSTYALTRAESHQRKAFIATAEVTDQEMRRRIEKHQAERGDSWTTIESPRDLAGAVDRIPPDCSIAVIDCLTVWLGNLMHVHGETAAWPEIEDLLTAIAAPRCDLVIVTNEVGLGIVPATPMGREFRDRAGRLNQRVAAAADEVVFVVSGIPMAIKERTS